MSNIVDDLDLDLKKARKKPKDYRPKRIVLLNSKVYSRGQIRSKLVDEFEKVNGQDIGYFIYIPKKKANKAGLYTGDVDKVIIIPDMTALQFSKGEK